MEREKGPKKTKRKRVALLAVTAITAAVLPLLLFPNRDADKITSLTSEELAVPKEESVEAQPSDKEVDVIEETPDNTPPSPPNSKQLEVPFIVQAPFGVWDPVHEDACEEASLLMVDYYLRGLRPESLSIVDDQLERLVAWQTERGYGKDVSIGELAQISQAYLGRNGARFIQDPTLDELRSEIAQGNPIIAPVAGQMLNNPHFRNGGPDYHMIVLVGYDEELFFAHDPGTKHGKDYSYSHQTIMDSIHDWTEGDIQSGRKAVLVFDSQR